MGACLPCLAGAAPTEEERKAATQALLIAAKTKDAAACQRAVRGGADVNVANTDFFNYTALHMFAGQGDLATCAMLIGKGATLDPRSTSEETPLIMAARSKHKEVAELLIERGADLNAKTNYDKSVQDYMADWAGA